MSWSVVGKFDLKNPKNSMLYWKCLKFSLLVPLFNTSIFSEMKTFTFIESVSKTAVGKMIPLPYLPDAFSEGGLCTSFCC